MSSESVLRSPSDTLGLATWVEVSTLLILELVGVVGAQWAGPTTGLGNALAMMGVLGSVGVVLLFHRLARDPWSALGLGRPESWGRTLLHGGLGALAVLGAGQVTMRILAALLGGETPDVSRFDGLVGNLPALLGTVAVVWITAALMEEVVYRGFLMGRLARLFGGHRRAWVAALVTSSAIFGVLHMYQGVSGVFATGINGGILAVIYLASGRNLWAAILAHGIANTVSLTYIYLGLAS